MTESLAKFAIHGPLSRGVRLVVAGKPTTAGPARSRAAAASALPQRPDAEVLSESIPLFFIGRNDAGLWVVRDAGGRAGGTFLLKRSALRFAKRFSVPNGYAAMFLAQRFELDLEDNGNPLVAWLAAMWRAAGRVIPAYPPPIPLGRKTFNGGRR
jgi:hypothetical protein